ncbi:MAG: 50S ribosomal protein L11 methyltransferase [Nitrospirae bacterium]|nr:50S ribosomal protein L11 methyltransferase [Nitrospirota bacterium]
MDLAHKEYLEVSVEVDLNFQETLSSYLIERGASGTWVDERKVKAYFNPLVFSLSQVEKQIAIFFLEFRREGVKVESGAVVVQTHPYEDWNAEWKKFFKPINVTPRLTISPPWESYTPKTNEEKVILIDPGLGFGTGTHPTTRNCLVFLDRILSAHPDPVQLKVLDLGSGSGILAIAAARLGAGYIVAADIDGDAVESMRNSFLLNQVHRHIRIRLGSIFQADRNAYDLILANLTAEDLILVSRELQGALLPEGGLILSGILAEKKEKLEKTLHELMLKKRDEIVEGPWVTQMWQNA